MWRLVAGQVAHAQHDVLLPAVALAETVDGELAVGRRQAGGNDAVDLHGGV
jgi:hypothetical protein